MTTRIVSAAIAIVFAVVMFLLHNTFLFSLVFAALVVVALWELFKCTKLDEHKTQVYICYAYGALTQLCHIFTSSWKINISMLLFVLFIIGLFCSFLRDYNSLGYKDLIVVAGLGTFIPYAFDKLLSMNYLEHGMFMMIITLCGAWLADSGAYFAGTFLGKTKLCPNISPKKTVEGVVGGVVTNGIIMIIVGLIYDFALKGPSLNYLMLFVSGMLCALLGLVGDLTASLIKRQTGIKDYGNIMPGHGGVMDRFDSVLLVAPFMYYVFTVGLIF